MRACATNLAPEMSSDEQTALRDALAFNDLKGIHLEIGTAAGGTLCNILTHYRDNLNRDLPPFLVIDPMRYFPAQKDVVYRNLEQHGLDPSSVQFLMTNSKDAFRQLKINPPELDFILIDGNHKVNYVIDDLMWARHLQTEGLLCLHDYNLEFPGVQLNAHRFLSKHKNYKIHTHVDSLLILKKMAPSEKLEVSMLDRIWAKTLAPFLQLKRSIWKRLRKN